MGGIPKGKLGIGSIFTSAALYDLLIIAGTTVLAAASIPPLLDPPNPHLHLAYGAIVATAVVLALVVIRFVLLVIQEKNKESPHELEGCLLALYGILRQDPANAFPGAKLRLVVHKPIKKGSLERLLQVTHYMGDLRATNGQPGRDFAPQSGVIGVALRKQEMSFGNRKTNSRDDYVQELVSDWGYTRTDAEKLDGDSMSWLAIPLTRMDSKLQAKVVDGIVYFDSTARGFFDETRIAIAALGCQGIALFVQQRYI